MKRFEHGGDVFGHPESLDFSANLNPLGMPQAAQRAIASCAQACVAYPDPHCRALTEAIAAHEQVPASWVVPCAGATDALYRLCLVCRPSQALVCAPCYSGYEEALDAVDPLVRVRYHKLREDEDFAFTARFADDLCRKDDLAFVANPNNPTGRCLSNKALAACVARACEVDALLVLDECFVELTECAGSTPLLAEHPNLVLVKALTKSHGLAGLRVGYALCADEEMATRLRRAGQPWAISTPAQLAGVAALEDRTFMARSVASIRAERAFLDGSLQSVGLRTIPSDANFLLFQAHEGLSEALARRGVLVRPCDNFVGLDKTWVRVAVRTHEENERLMAALRSALEEVRP